MDDKIELRSVYKIFGDQPTGRALQLARAHVPKDRIQEITDHVVGLDDVSFGVREGEIFVVMGLSGSGKSTAIRTVNKLHTTTAGEVFVDGIDVQKLNGRALQEFRRQKLGMVFQHFALFPHRKVIDNAGYGLGRPGHRQGQPRPRRAQGARTGRSRPLRQLLSPRALRGHAAARRSGPRAGRRSRHPAHGRGLQRARPADPPPDAGRHDGRSRAICTRPSSSSPTTSTRRCASAIGSAS